MELSINIKDKIKLNFDVKEFHIIKYFDGDESYSFNNIQLNITKFTNDFKRIVHSFLPCYAPIILSNYEEQILKITIENGRKIGYTKSLRIDLLNAIEEDEIKVNNLPIYKEAQKNNHIFENFVNNLLDCNVNFACGLITKSERKNQLISSFHEFYMKMFKDEIQQRIIEEKKLTNEEFFSIRWKGRLDKINDVIFIWSTPSNNSQNWVSQFRLEGIKRGVDKKTNFRFNFGGIYISRGKYGDSNKCEVTLNIQLSEKNYLSTSTDIDDFIFDVEFWEKNKGVKKIEIKNLWQNKEFIKFLDKVIKSPIW